MCYKAKKLHQLNALNPIQSVGMEPVPLVNPVQKFMMLKNVVAVSP